MNNAVQAFIAKCNATTSITDVFGHRITEDHVPDKQPYPHARVLEITTNQLYTFEGEGGREVLLQVDVYADTAVLADASAEAIRAVFSGYKGAIGSIDAGMVKARITSGSFFEATRKHWRLIEIDILTSN